MKRFTSLCLLIIAAASIGCGSIAPPSPWWTRGSIDQRRRDDTQFDPYPSNQVGPVIEGGRPPYADATQDEFRYLNRQRP